MDPDLHITCVHPVCVENLRQLCDIKYIIETRFKNILKGAIVLCKDGLISCESGPAIINPDGRKVWLYEGGLHRLDGPVYIGDKDLVIWAMFGKFHRRDGPAIRFTVGGLIWCLDGKIHRENGPAYEASADVITPKVRNYIIQGGIHFADPKNPKHVHREWWLYGKRHCSNGPAVLCNICPDEYWVAGELHHVDGPAVIYKNGRKDYYLAGKLIKTENLVPTQLDEAGKRPRDEQDMPEITISYFGYEIVTYADAKPAQRRRVETAEEPTEEEATAK